MADTESEDLVQLKTTSWQSVRVRGQTHMQWDLINLRGCTFPPISFIGSCIPTVHLTIVLITQLTCVELDSLPSWTQLPGGYHGTVIYL